VDARDFLAGVCADLRAALLDGREIEIEVDAQDAPLSVNQAQAVGLLVNELVTNAVKHAFGERGRGHIVVRFQRRGEGYHLTVADNGRGYGQAGVGQGHRLVNLLVAQLSGDLRVENAPGATFSITFPDELRATERMVARARHPG
jgi:two-component system, sensor histidine kinase PdtaS